jgi:hypothetical protein
MYYVCKREDGYIFPSAYPPRDVEVLGEYAEWVPALHDLLDFRGFTTETEHLAWNCTQCFQERSDSGIDYAAVFAVKREYVWK